jgi:transcriptional regulator with XRE-family HTH domain
MLILLKTGACLLRRLLIYSKGNILVNRKIHKGISVNLRDVGNRLKALRKDRTQKEFSSIYGIHQGTLSKFEHGQLEPGLDFLAEVSKREGVPIQWILTGESEEPAKKGLLREPASEYLASTPTHRKLLNSVNEIVESGNEVILEALKANLRAYLEAIRTAKKSEKGKGRAK